MAMVERRRRSDANMDTMRRLGRELVGVSGSRAKQKGRKGSTHNPFEFVPTEMTRLLDRLSEHRLPVQPAGLPPPRKDFVLDEPKPVYERPKVEVRPWRRAPDGAPPHRPPPPDFLQTMDGRMIRNPQAPFRIILKCPRNHLLLQYVPPKNLDPCLVGGSVTCSECTTGVPVLVCKTCVFEYYLCKTCKKARIAAGDAAKSPKSVRVRSRTTSQHTAGTPSPPKQAMAAAKANVRSASEAAPRKGVLDFLADNGLEVEDHEEESPEQAVAQEPQAEYGENTQKEPHADDDLSDIELSACGSFTKTQKSHGEASRALSASGTPTSLHPQTLDASTSLQPSPFDTTGFGATTDIKEVEEEEEEEAVKYRGVEDERYDTPCASPCPPRSDDADGMTLEETSLATGDSPRPGGTHRLLEVEPLASSFSTSACASHRRMLTSSFASRSRSRSPQSQSLGEKRDSQDSSGSRKYARDIVLEQSLSQSRPSSTFGASRRFVNMFPIPMSPGPVPEELKEYGAPPVTRSAWAKSKTERKPF